MARFYEDIPVGEARSFGRRTVTAEEIVEFAEQFDPQPMHTDREAAAETMYGGLIASGWHTASLTMRMLVDEYLSETATVGGKGVDELRWRRPVRPGDTLSVDVEVLDKSVETPDRGLVRTRTATHNDDGEAVFTMVALVMMARRDGGD